jgi:hypothetical protein
MTKLTNSKINYLGTFSLLLLVVSTIFISIYPTQNIHADVAFSSVTNLSNDSIDSVIPQIVATGNNVYAIWKNNTATNAEIYFKSSTNKGVSFGSAINISGTSGVLSNTPQIDASGNRAYVVWSEGNSNFNISFTNGTNASFDTPIILSGSSVTSVTPQIAVSSSHVYVVWRDTSGTDQIFFANSTNDGDSFHTPQSIASGAITSTKDPQITASNSRAYVVWQEDANIRFRNSTSDGDFNFAAATLGTTSSAGVFALPQIAVSGNNVYSVWKKSNDIYFANSTNDGDSFHSAVNLSNSATAELPQVTASGNNVYVIWHDTSGKIYFTASTNKGDNFSTPISIGTTGSTAGNGTPQINATGNSVHAIWEDNTAGSNDDIFFKSSTDNGATFCNANNISNDAGESGTPQIAIAGTNVYALWRNGTDTTGADTEVFFKSGLSTTECVRFNASQYKLSESAIIRINDTSANGGSTETNRLVNIKSTSDTSGINVSFNEVSANNGTFTSTNPITFTTGTSSGNALKASAGDTITATTPAGQTSTASIYPITVTFGSASYTLGDRALITVTDQNSNTDSGSLQSITITVSTPTDSVRLVLVETGVNTGIFAKDKLIFYENDGLIPITSTVTVSASEVLGSSPGTNSTSHALSNTAIDTTGIAITSDSDATGIVLKLVETGVVTREFNKALTLTTSTSVPNTSIHVQAGEILNFNYRGAVSRDGSLALVTPNTNSSVAAVKLVLGNTVTASFGGKTGTATTGVGGGAGGGGGGVSRAGLVVQAVGAIALLGNFNNHGGSGPPSFDSSSFTLKEDGVKRSPESLSSNPSFTVGKKSDVSMGFKMPGGLDDLNHISLYANIDKGQGKYDSDTYIYFDKYKTPQITIHDPHGFFKSVNIGVTEPSRSNLDVNYAFDFVKSLDKSNVIFEAWNNDRQSAITELPDLLKVNDPTKPEETPEIQTIQPATQERLPVPDWLKSNAAWWGKGNIDDTEFANGIGYLIQKQIIDVPELLQKNTSPEKIENPDGILLEPQEKFTPVVPDWIKNTASWWSEGKLTDDDFLVGIKYLLEKGIIQVKT